MVDAEQMRRHGESDDAYFSRLLANKIEYNQVPVAEREKYLQHARFINCQSSSHSLDGSKDNKGDPELDSKEAALRIQWYKDKRDEMSQVLAQLDTMDQRRADSAIEYMAHNSATEMLLPRLARLDSGLGRMANETATVPAQSQGYEGENVEEMQRVLAQVDAMDQERAKAAIEHIQCHWEMQTLLARLARLDMEFNRIAGESAAAAAAATSGPVQTPIPATRRQSVAGSRRGAHALHNPAPATSIADTNRAPTATRSDLAVHNSQANVSFGP